MKLKSIIAAALCAVGFAAFAEMEKVQLWEDGPYFAACNVGAEKPEDFGIYTNFDGAAQAVTDALGEGWRVPTEEDFTNLLANCDCSWTNDYNGTSIAGRVFTSKSDPSKSIFLPAAGVMSPDDGLIWVGNAGLYWTSTTDAENDAIELAFDGSVAIVHVDWERSVGMSVRAVQDTQDVTDPCKLTVPTVAHATAVVTKNGRVVSDLTKIQKGSEVVVTWTADEGYVITAGEIETILMSGNKTAKRPTVDVIKWSTVLEPWFDDLETGADISTNGVKLTGGKTCVAGTVLSLSATAPKKAPGAGDEWVFAGWYSAADADCALDNGTQDWRLASGYKFTTGTNDVTLVARFVPKFMDVVGEITCQPANPYEKGEQMAPLAVTVVSYSKPTVTMKPLPAGMKFDANALVVTGTPTKDGEEQTAIITVKNVSGAKATKSVVLKVKDLEAKGGLSGLKYDTGYTFIPGDTDLESVLGSQLLNELGLGGWTVSGLPAGMKWDKNKKTITGAATKELTSYTVKFTNATNMNDIATVSFRTSAFPVTTLEPWFDYCDLNEEEHGIATYGVKLTGGKACAAGTVLSLSATAPKAVKERGDEWVFAGWYSEKGAYDSALNNGTQDWRLASGYKFTSLTNDVTIFARFVPKSVEAQYAKVECSPSTSEYKTGVEISPSIPVEATAYTLPTVKVTGLPAGLKFTDKDVFNKTNKIASANTIYGTPTKSGVYVATVTMTTAGKATAATSLKFIVRKDGELKVDVDYDATKGKVTGAGIYQAGKKATLKATANKGYVFNGWYASEKDTVPMSQVTSYVIDPMPTNDVTLAAKFLATADDWAKVECSTTKVECATGAAIEPIVVTAEGGSLPTVKVTGLPSGVKFTDKDVFNKTNKIASANTIYGTPTKSGVYTALVTVTTAGKKTATETLKFIVRKEGELVVDVDYDAAMGKVTGAGIYKPDTKASLKATANKGYVFYGWLEDKTNLLSQATSYSYPVGSNDVTLTAKFIEAEMDKALIFANVNGLKLSSFTSLTQATNVSCGVYLEWPVLSGALTKPTTVKVSGLPSGLKFKDGMIYGAPTAASKTDTKGNVTPSKVKVTVTSAGKSKMEFVIELTVDPLPAWAVGNFDGYHMEFGATNGTFTATVDKTGKVSGKTAGGIASTTFSAASFGKVFTLDGTNLVYAVDVTVSYKDPETRKTVKTVDTLYLMEDLGTGLGVIGGGDTNGCGCVGIQRAWDRKDLELPEFDTTALNDPLVLENGITLKFGAKGKVTVGGKVKGDNGDLVAVSGSTYAMPVAWKDEANLLAQVYVYVAPKTNLKTGVSEVYEVLLTVGARGKIDKVSIAPQIVD